MQEREKLLGTGARIQGTLPSKAFLISLSTPHSALFLLDLHMFPSSPGASFKRKTGECSGQGYLASKWLGAASQKDYNRDIHILPVQHIGQAASTPPLLPTLHHTYEWPYQLLSHGISCWKHTFLAPWVAQGCDAFLGWGRKQKQEGGDPKQCCSQNNGGSRGWVAVQWSQITPLWAACGNRQKGIQDFTKFGQKQRLVLQR